MGCNLTYKHLQLMINLWLMLIRIRFEAVVTLCITEFALREWHGLIKPFT